MKNFKPTRESIANLVDATAIVIWIESAETETDKITKGACKIDGTWYRVTKCGPVVQADWSDRQQRFVDFSSESFIEKLELELTEATQRLVAN